MAESKMTINVSGEPVQITVEVNAGSLRGPQGIQGEKGEKGDPGVSPKDAILYTPQALTADQQTQARSNIGAAAQTEVERLSGDVVGVNETLYKLQIPFSENANPFTKELEEGRALHAVSAFHPIQSGSGEPSTDNIRPISGRTGAELVRCGKNLCNEVLVQGTRGTSGSLMTGANYTGVTIGNLVPVVPGMTLYVSTSHDVLDGGFRYYLYDRDKQLVYTANVGNQYNAAVPVPEGVYYFAFQYTGSTYAEYIGEYAMVSNGEFRSYEPYQGDTSSVDFGQTVYGGTLDWNTGVLTVDRAMTSLTGTENKWTSSTGTSGKYQISFSASNIVHNTSVVNVTGGLICSHYAEATPNDTYYCRNGISVGTNGSVNIYDDAYAALTIDDYNAYLAEQYAAGTPVQVCYRLATPTVIQLTPQNLFALAGINNIYTDCDELTVESGSESVWFTNNVLNRLLALETQAAAISTTIVES